MVVEKGYKIALKQVPTQGQEYNPFYTDPAVSLYVQKLERLRSTCGRGEKAIFWNYNHEKRPGGELQQREVNDIQREGREGKSEKVNDVLRRAAAVKNTRND